MAELSSLIIGIIGLILTAILAVKYRCMQCLHRRISEMAVKARKSRSSGQAAVSTVNSEADDDFDHIPRPAIDDIESPSYHEFAYGHPTFGLQTRFFPRPMVLRPPPAVYMGALRGDRSRSTPGVESTSPGQPRLSESLILEC
ncbi:hypothetical protein EDC01DRAFT_680824 [Geopyxis carbonaria]|nr:hypothetical protein EDC01DRAFT_680824 [Geopyxis carbonaria]